MNWVDGWNQMLLSNDFVNANTGVLDPRHMFGVTNQDVFRWPAVRQGTERMLLGQFVTTILLPGIPLLLWEKNRHFMSWPTRRTTTSSAGKPCRHRLLGTSTDATREAARNISTCRLRQREGVPG